jgi:DNA-binding YbaB/EbfC family protein
MAGRGYCLVVSHGERVSAHFSGCSGSFFICFFSRGSNMSNDDFTQTPNLIKQAQLIQEKMTQLQKETNHKTVTASSGGGMVTVTVNGAFQIVSMKIDKQIVNPDDIEMLSDLIIAATNQA